jgi:hypothetical protein
MPIGPAQVLNVFKNFATVFLNVFKTGRRETMEPQMATYVVYLLISAVLTVWVASVLSRNGRIFLADVYNHDEHLVVAVNQLLVVGFYLINIGFVALLLQVGGEVSTAAEAVKALALRIGVVALVIGGVHMVNVAVFNVIRRRRMDEQYIHGKAARRIRVEPAPPLT